MGGHRSISGANEAFQTCMCFMNKNLHVYVKQCFKADMTNALQALLACEAVAARDLGSIVEPATLLCPFLWGFSGTWPMKVRWFCQAQPPLPQRMT